MLLVAEGNFPLLNKLWAKKKSTLNKRLNRVTSCTPPSDRGVEYFMIKRAIILHRSRPRLRLKGGRKGGAQITVQTPSQQRKGTELRSEGARGGAKPSGLIHAKHRQRKQSATLTGRSIDFYFLTRGFNSVPGGNQQGFRGLSQVTARDPAATTLTTRITCRVKFCLKMPLLKCRV